MICDICVSCVWAGVCSLTSHSGRVRSDFKGWFSCVFLKKNVITQNISEFSLSQAGSIIFMHASDYLWDFQKVKRSTLNPPALNEQAYGALCWVL